MCFYTMTAVLLFIEKGLLIMTLILPTGELCFEPVVFNRRQHQQQDLMGGLLPLSALSAYRDPHIPQHTLASLHSTASSICFSHQGYYWIG